MFRTLLLTALLLPLTGAAALADDDANALAAESLAAYKRSEAIEKEMREATRAESRAYDQISQMIYALQRKDAPKADDITKQEQRIADLEAQLETARAKLMVMKARANMTPEQLKARIAELQAERTNARAKVKEAQQPFRDKIGTVTGPLDAKKAAFEALMGKLLHAKADGTNIVSRKISVQPGDAFFSVSWYDEANKQQIWCHIRLRDKPEIRKGAELLGGKHYISTSSSGQLWLWAGHFQIAFVPSTKPYKNEAKLKEMIQKLIDLDALAAIDASPKEGGPEMTEGK